MGIVEWLGGFIGNIGLNHWIKTLKYRNISILMYGNVGIIACKDGIIWW